MSGKGIFLVLLGLFLILTIAATVKSIAGSIATDPQLAAISYTNGNSASVIHFFNLDFTAETGFLVKKDVTVTTVPFLMKGRLC